MSVFKRLVDYRLDESFAIRLRRKRFAFFKDLLFRLPKPIKVLDVGGTETFWERMGFIEWVDLTILNMVPPEKTYEVKLCGLTASYVAYKW